MSDYPTLREESLNQAYGRGHASALEILKDSFGGQIPQELDLVNAPNYDVKFRGMLSDPLFYVSTLVSTIKDHWLSLGIWGFVMHSPVGAAAVFLGSAALDTIATKGYVRSNEPNTITMNGLWGMARHFDAANGGLADTVAHESTHLLEVNDQNESLSSAFDDRIMLSNLFNERSGFVKYLTSEAEMQARLFTIVTNAYIQHGRVPTNKYELWATLASQGVTPPDSILQVVRRDPQARAAFAKFPKSDYYVENFADTNASGDYERVQKSIDTETNKFQLWDKAYPFLYGDLLEIMGDRLGHKRMGGDHNIQLREIFMRAAKENMDGTLSDADTIAKMKKVAGMMPADDAVSLMQLVASGGAYKEYNPEVIFIPMGRLRAIAAFSLATNKGVKPQVAAAALHRATGFAPHAWKRQMEDAERYVNAKNVTTSVPVTNDMHRKGPWGLSTSALRVA